jgi:MFS transporter, DHA1 family, multidrug resistance protein
LLNILADRCKLNILLIERFIKQLPAVTQLQDQSPTYKALLTATCSIAFASYFATSLRLPVMPLFAVSLGATTSEVGFINSSFLLMCGLLALPLGLLGDRWGRKRIISLGLVVASGTSLLLYWSRTPLELIGIYLGFGVGLAMIGPSLMAQVADISPVTHLGRAYGWYTTSIYTAMSMGPAVGGVLAQVLGYRLVFLAVAVALFLLLGPVLLILPRNRPNIGHNQPGAFASLVQEGWHNHALQGCWAVTLGSCIALGVFFTFFPLYALKHGLNAGQIGLVFAAQAIVNALSRIPLGKMSDQADKTKLAIWGFLGLSAVLVGFGLSHNLTAFIILAMVSGAVQGLGFTPLGALISEVVPVESRGLAMGGYNTAIYLGMMLGSAGMGPIIQVIGFEPGFFLAAVINLMFTGGFYTIFRGNKSL